ncbi:hypothetical protein O0L34_g12898 [Tuta absoluta]|nr:hypothetical protein O0L34_g12898 [Tuta absoluta]
MAPHWVVLGDRKIILDGKPGELIQPVKAKEGQDGRPGMPGGNAGNFLGYGDKITNSEKLFISANGGNGSPGQAGGDGKPGRDGAVPEIKYNSLSYYWMTEPEPHDNVVDWQSRNFMVYSGNRYSCDILLTVCRNYKVIGTSCSDGGDGGRGGVGGEGGTAGVVRVPQIEFRAKNGNNGVPGAHGIGGAAGKYSATISVHERRECYITYKTKYYSQTGITYHQCNSGKAQQGVYNSVGMRLRSSSESNVLDDRKFSPAIGDFKAYLQQNINKTYRKQYLLNILSQVHF